VKQLSTKRHSEASKRPFVFVNMAVTADGKIATANRVISSFGSRRDQEHLFELRATADAVMMGARTVEADNVSMGPGPGCFRRMRLNRGMAESNLRVIVSRRGSVNPEATVFQHRFSPIIVLTTRSAPKARLERLKRVADEVVAFGNDSIDFRKALRWLQQSWRIERLLSEGGGELNEALFRAGLVDEIHLTVCPWIFGGRSAPTIADGKGFARLAEARQFEVKKLRPVADELFVVLAARRKQSSPSRTG
jgi:riboflavin-specific deaminase-like protein